MNEQYYVETDGQRYGPATAAQLQQWASEGRIVPDSVLIDTLTERRTIASLHPALAGRFAATPAGAGVGSAARASDYAPPGYGGGVAQTPYAPTAGAYAPPSTGYTPPGNAWAAPAPILGDYRAGNDSGTGAGAQLPAELRGVNFGAFMIPFWWSIFNKSYIGLLCLIPYVGGVMSFVLLFKGNEWAWQNRRFDSVEHFRAVQRAWNMWGIVALALSFGFGVLYAILILTGAIKPDR